jgi:hypothetical protein
MLAAESFNELLAYHRRNSLRLSRGASKQMSAIKERHRKSITDFRGTNPDYPYSPDDWLQIWQRFDKESPEMREILEDEFRASLGDTRAKLSRLRRWFRS